jgi:hypothetical protein
MTVRGVTINGKVTAAALSIVGAGLLGWAGWVSQGVQAEVHKNIQQDGWITGHEQWTQTTYAGVRESIASVNARLTEKSNVIENQIVVQTESLGEWKRDRTASDLEWRNQQREQHREVMNILRELQVRDK